MKASAFTLALLAGSACAMAAAAQPPTPPGPQPPDVIDMPDTMGAAKLKVMSDDIKEGVLLPNANSAYGASMSPQVSWSKGPPGTKSYAVLLEDSDAQARGLPPQGTAALPPGMVFGNNITGKPAYFGPRTPPGATHHYHLEVLALDTVLPLESGAPRNTFVEAAKGHVLASGQVTGLFTGPPPAPK